MATAASQSNPLAKSAISSTPSIQPTVVRDATAARTSRISLPVTTSGQRGYTFAVSDLRWLITLMATSSAGLDCLGLLPGFCAVQGWDLGHEEWLQYQQSSTINHVSGKVEAATGIARAVLLGLGGLFFVAFRVVQITSALFLHAGLVLSHALTQAGLILAAVGFSLFAGFFVILGAVSSYKLKQNYDFQSELDKIKTDKETVGDESAIYKNVFEFLKKKLELSDIEKNKSEEEQNNLRLCKKKDLAALIGADCVKSIEDLIADTDSLEPSEESLFKLYENVEKNTQTSRYIHTGIVVMSVIGTVALVLGALFNPVTGVIIATTALTAVFILMMFVADAYTGETETAKSGPVGELDRRRIKQALCYAVACLVVAVVIAAIIGTGGIAFIAPAIIYMGFALLVYYRADKRLQAQDLAYKTSQAKLAEEVAQQSFKEQQHSRMLMLEKESQQISYLQAVANYFSGWAAWGSWGTLSTTLAATQND